jgi:hypothetical protein
MASIQHLVKAHAITAAQTIAQQGKTHKLPDTTEGLIVEATFVYSGGGTTAIAYVQTSLDGGNNWIDIMAFNFATASARKILAVNTETGIVAAVTPAVGALTANTAVTGIIGDRVRCMVVTTGTYTGTNTLDLYMRIEDEVR